MIVQCEHCQTKYRISEDKIKGKGAKVRCAKCKNVFTVAPPTGEPAAPAPAPAPERQPPEPAPHPPAPPEVPGPGASTEPSGEPVPPLGESPVFGEPADSELPAPFPPFEAPGEPAPPAQEEPFFESGSSRPAHERDRPGGPSSTEEPSEGAEEPGFELESTLRDEPAGFEPPTLDSPPASTPPQPTGEQGEEAWGNIALGTSSEGEGAGEDGFHLSDAPAYQPPEPSPMEDPEPAERFDIPSEASRESSLAAREGETASSSRGGRKGLVFLLFLVLLGAGGYYAYPTVMDIIQSRGQQPQGTLAPTDVQVKPLNRTDGRVLYSVRGKVHNQSSGNVGMIKVEAQFRNAEGNVLSRAESYCGNVFSDSELASMDLERILADLQNELGQSLSNANILPGKMVPFLIVLDSPPAGVNKVTVTITAYKETT